jgi:o-succinylbenzoate synthase
MFESLNEIFSAQWKRIRFKFKRPGGTSRGVLNIRDSWFIKVFQKDDPQKYGVGECAPLNGLSIDDLESMDNVVQALCRNIDNKYFIEKVKIDFPSVKFGLEMALIDYKTGGERILFESEFSKGVRGIPINGLIWMGPPHYMYDQIYSKIESGFRCIKLKIGALDFQEELDILKKIRSQFSKEDIELRVDANGAFPVSEAGEKLKQLSEYDLHSIEQPISIGQTADMAKLCEATPVPIALDEELIGIHDNNSKVELLNQVEPQYLIIKPTLLGGFAESIEWINAANLKQIPWWVTSALESNIGLNAIAQWTDQLGSRLTQGLGTGQLFLNNFPCPLRIDNGELKYRSDATWDLSAIDA